MKLCITGGGTGGHLMVAEALAHSAVKKGYEVIFIGSQKGQDKKYFENSSLFKDVYFLKTSGVVDKKGFGKISSLFHIFKAFLKARKILKENKIEVTYSVGGFSSAPASFATLSLKIPLFIHEQNAVEGRLNALLKPYTKNFISAYDSNSTIKGYPVKESFFQNARVRKELKTMIFLGGSQGAKAINDLALSLAKELKNRDIKIIHQTGENDFERVKKSYMDLDISVELYSFTQELDKIITRADLAVSRAGASTLWELTSNALPTFYIPYPYSAGDHQYYNAKFIVDNNLGWCERETKNLKNSFLEIFDNLSLEKKSEGLLNYASKDVADKMIKDLKRDS